ncbi:MAG: hypothetical protein D6701_09545, partial [Gemmatimonadetes bacterium]
PVSSATPEGLAARAEVALTDGLPLVLAGGGAVMHADGREAVFNRPDPRVSDFLAGPRALLEALRRDWLGGGRGAG